MQLKLKVEKTR